MASRGFNTGKTATLSYNKMVANFENMLKNVDNMIQSNNIYSVWIRLVIGKDKNSQIVFNSASQDKDENLFMSLHYEKSGAGTGNKFVFKVAYDLFNYGQETRKNVEKLDELMYKAMNLSEEKAEDGMYCQWQYGYNVYGNTQIVSPLYTGLLTSIEPSIDYANGKTFYTLSGLSYITKTDNVYSYDQIGNNDTKTGSWNGLDLVLWILWYYHGNPDTVSSLPRDYSGNIGNQHPDVANGRSQKFNIDIPVELMNTASNVYMDAMPGITPIDYCKEVLKKTYNTADKHYDTDSGEYKLESYEAAPHYTLYITDGNDDIPTVHIGFEGSTVESNAKTIDFNFNWFKKSNNIVIGWQPQVDMMVYLLSKNKRAILKDELEELEDGNTPYEGDELRKQIEKKKAELNSLNAELSNSEYFKSTLTLVGIPSDIPLNIILNIKPQIFESVSRTQGQYYLTASTDDINTNGLFTTTLSLFRINNLK